MLALINHCDKSISEFSQFLTELKIEHKLTDKEAEIIHADKIILYGTGKTKDAIKYFHIQNLFTVLRICKKPFLGIGTGCSLLTEFSNEDKAACLGIFKATAEPFSDTERLENTGSFSVEQIKENPILNNISPEKKFYFSNKLYIPENCCTTAITGNKLKYSAILKKDGFTGIQFLPEKSGDVGIKVLMNFINS